MILKTQLDNNQSETTGSLAKVEIMCNYLSFSTGLCIMSVGLNVHVPHFNHEVGFGPFQSALEPSSNCGLAGASRIEHVSCNESSTRTEG